MRIFPIDEDEAADLLKEIEKQLKKRQWGEAIRLEVEDGIDKRLVEDLQRMELKLSEDDVYYHSTVPLDLTFLMKMYGMDGFDASEAVPKIYAAAGSRNCRRMQDIFDEHPKAMISSCIIHTRPLSRSWILSEKQQKIRRYLRSSRRFTESAVIRRSSRHWHRRQKTASRFLFWWS